MKKAFFFIFIFTLLFSSCLRIDDYLFNNSEKIVSYKMDEYPGKVDFKLKASYKIPDSLVTLFTLGSRAADEENSTKIYAIYIGDISKIAQDTVIMYCHGNKFHMDFYWQRAKLLANTGWKNRFGVLMVDYRGYGLSEGHPTEEGMYADVNAGLAWLNSKGLSSDRLVIYGFSLGGAPATKFSAEPHILRPSRLILEAPFASAEELVQGASVLDVPSSFVTNIKVNNAEKIKSVKVPFLWLHGINDNFLDINTHGELVYKNYSGSYSEALRIAGADHGNIPVIMGFNNYSNKLEEFIER